MAINTVDVSYKGGPREKKRSSFSREMTEAGTEKQRKEGLARKDSGA